MRYVLAPFKLYSENSGFGLEGFILGGGFVLGGRDYLDPLSKAEIPQPPKRVPGRAHAATGPGSRGAWRSSHSRGRHTGGFGHDCIALSMMDILQDLRYQNHWVCGVYCVLGAAGCLS